MKQETLRNGVPLDVQLEPYEFEATPPLPIRVGDECVIRTERHGSVRVILLRGTGRKRWLVKVSTLKRYLREDARRRIDAVYAGKST